MKNIIPIISSKYQEEVCEKLNNDIFYKISGYILYKSDTTQYNTSKNKVILDSYDIYNIYNIKDYKIISNYSISLSEWRKVKEYESIYLQMTDRCNIYSKHISDLRRLYYNMIKLWFGIFKEYEANIVLYFSTPHDPLAFSSYIVANILDIDIRIINRTLYVDNSVISNGIDLFNDNKNYFMKKPATQSGVLSGTIKAERVSKTIIKNVVKENMYSFISYINYSKFLLLYLLRGRAFRESVRLISGPKNRLSMIAEFVKLYRMNIMNKRLNDSNCAQVNEGEAYVVFAAHYQPEKSTLPEGGMFDDHLLAIDTLLHYLPRNITVCYKEHPRSFDYYDLRRKTSRSKKFYESLLSNPRVKLINPFTNTDELIKKSMAVCTITGSLGWDALNQGIPVILFGNPWYSKCEACLHVNNFTKNNVYQHLKLLKVDVYKMLETFILWFEDYNIQAPANSEKINDKFSELLASAILYSFESVKE